MAKFLLPYFSTINYDRFKVFYVFYFDLFLTNNIILIMFNLYVLLFVVKWPLNSYFFIEYT